MFFCLQSTALKTEKACFCLASSPPFVFADCSSLLYVVQQQPLGSIQWSVVASNLRESNYTVTSLSKGVRYAFRVLASTGKTLSKPSLSTDLVQLLDRGIKAQGRHEVIATGVWNLFERICCYDYYPLIGPYLRKAPIILEKPNIVYMVENQPANITITLNHVHAVVTWKRLVPPSLLTLSRFDCESERAESNKGQIPNIWLCFVCTCRIYKNALNMKCVQVVPSTLLCLG